MSDLTQMSSIGFKTAVREAVGISAGEQDLQAAILAGQVTKGGLLMRVRARSPELEARALRILPSHAACHVHSHSLAA